MKLESLKSSKFEAMPENVMKHIVGGQKCATPAGEHETSAGCVKHSNDYSDDGNLVYADGGDFSEITINRLQPCNFEGSVTPNLTSASNGGNTIGISL